MQTSKAVAAFDRRRFLITGTAGASAAWLGWSGIAHAAADAPAASASLEQRLAQFAVAVRYEDLPPTVVEACKRFLLDALACGFGAVGSAPASLAEATFRQAFGSAGRATLIGSAQPISTEGAVLVNGTLIRQLDLNDVYFGKDPSHPSEMVPVALACCEEAGRSGRDLIEAMVVGYETEVRFNDAFSWASRGLIASSAAAFLAPLVAGKAWRLTSEQIVQAMGISGPRQLTTLAVNSGAISMMKSVGPGYTAMDGVFSTRLAAAGMSGVSRSLQWLAGNVEPRQAGIDVDLDAQHYVLTKVGLKRFPLQGELQAVAEAGVNLHMPLQGQTASVEAIVVEAYPGTIGRGVAEPEKYRPANRETADHSLPVCLAMALIDGDVSVQQFAQDRWQAADVSALAQKVKVVTGQSLMAQMPQGHGTMVQVRLRNGRILTETVLIPEGDAERPMSKQAMEHKFRQLTEPVLGAAGSERVLACIGRLEQLDDVRALTQLLHGRA